MADATTRSVAQGTLLWKMFYAVTYPFVTKAIVAHDARGRTRDQIAIDMTNESLGPTATLPSREDAVSSLATAVIAVPFAAYLVVLVVALVLRPSIGNVAGGNLCGIAAALMFPIVGIGLPLSWRWWRASRELRSWQSQGEPEGEHASDASLPGAIDVVLGLLAGGTLSVMLLVGLITS